MSVTVRLLKRDDSIGELTALLHAAYAQLGAVGFNYTAVDQTQDVTFDRIAGGECYVAEVDGRIVGTILFCDPVHSYGCPWFNRPEVASFHQFGVLPPFQRQGVGGALLAFAEARARETGATEIALDTSEGAADLIHWYYRRGYRQVAHVQWEGKKYRSVIMSKLLEQTST